MKKIHLVFLAAITGLAGCMETANMPNNNPSNKTISATDTTTGSLAGGKFDFTIDEFANRVTAFITPRTLKDCTLDFTGVCEQQSYARLVVSCELDGMSDAVSCYMRVDPQEIVTRNERDTKNSFNYDTAGGVVFNTSASGSLKSLCVVGHDFPGRTAQIRVDSNSPVATNSKACLQGPPASKVFAQAKKGSVILTRRVEWPYEQPKDRYAKIDDLIQVGVDVLADLRASGRGPLK